MALTRWLPLPPSTTTIPYSVNYLKSYIPISRSIGFTEFESFDNDVADNFYVTLSQFWECYEKRDIKCLSRLTYVHDMCTVGPYKKSYRPGAWRISLNDRGLPPSCLDPSFARQSSLMWPSFAYISEAEQFYRCIFDDNFPSRYDSTPYVKHFERVLKTPYVFFDPYPGDIREAKSIAGAKHHLEIELRDSPTGEASAKFLYGTPANPSGFALISVDAVDSYNDCVVKAPKKTSPNRQTIITEHEKLLDETGGGYDIWYEMNNKVKRTDVPYTKEYVIRKFAEIPAPLAKEIAEVFYSDIQKIWKCFQDKDPACLGKMTYIFDQCKIEEGKRDESFAGKLRVVLSSKGQLTACQDKGEFFNSVQVRNRLFHPTVFISDSNKYYQCLAHPSFDRIDTKLEHWPRAQYNRSYDILEFIGNVSKSAFFNLTIVAEDKAAQSIKEVKNRIVIDIGKYGQHGVEKEITLRYGTPANPTGFAIVGFGGIYGEDTTCRGMDDYKYWTSSEYVNK